MHGGTRLGGRRNGELFLVRPSDRANPHPHPWLIQEHLSPSCVPSSELWAAGAWSCLQEDSHPAGDMAGTRESRSSSRGTVGIDGPGRATGGHKS